MLAGKLTGYRVVQWAQRTYADAKKTHPWFNYGAGKAEQLSSPVVAALPKLPGAKAVDSAAAQTVTHVEGLVAATHTRLGAVHAAAAAHADRAFVAAEKLGTRHAAVAWAVRAPLRVGDAVVRAVLPAPAADAADAADATERVAGEPRTLAEALDKHVDLVHTVRTRVAGKTFRQLLGEAARGSSASAVRLADWAVAQLPGDVQEVVCDAEMRRKDGLILYAIRVAAAATKFCAWTLPARLLNAVRAETHRATEAVGTRAAHEMQELGARGMKAADQARTALRRRAAAAGAAFGRTGTEPSDEKQDMNGGAAAAPAAAAVAADGEGDDEGDHSD